MRQESFDELGVVGEVEVLDPKVFVGVPDIGPTADSEAEFGDFLDGPDIGAELPSVWDAHWVDDEGGEGDEGEGPVVRTLFKARLPGPVTSGLFRWKSSTDSKAEFFRDENGSHVSSDGGYPFQRTLYWKPVPFFRQSTTSCTS